jgi:predicted phosphodiesterase
MPGPGGYPAARSAGIAMKFIHAADLHLDSPLRGLEAHEAAPTVRLRSATRHACENLVQLALAEHVDLLVIAGDVYDGDWKDYSTGLFFRAQMVRLRDAGIPVFLIAGNHDAASVISRKLSLPENVHVFSTRTVESREVEGRPWVVHGRGFPNRAVPENLARDYPPAVPGKFNLGLLHTSLTGRPEHDTYAPCTEQDLREKGYDYWALGHIHQPEVVSRDPWIVFAGNCQGRHIRETGPRGCQLVQVNSALRVESVEPRALDVVRWHELRVDLVGSQTESEALRRVRAAMEQTVAGADGRLVAARIVLAGHTPLHGVLHRDGQRWQAELLACAQDQGPEALWIERIKLETAPVYDVAQLAQRDALTKLVLDGLAQARDTLTALPDDIGEMLSLLPTEVRDELQGQWSGEQRQAVLNDVQAIVLEALATKGGQLS